MANRLKMANHDAILQLHALHWPQRRITRELGIDRATVARHLARMRRQGGLANAAISPPGSDLGIRAAIVATGSGAACTGEEGLASRPGRPSQCEPFRQVIAGMLGQELSAQRIFQDLTGAHGYRGGYDSVKRFVRRLAADGAPLPMRRMECAPGFEAQIDFGTGAPVITPDGKRRKTHVFRIVLSHSRKAYSETSFRQTTEDFLRCIENAFWHFGGVPQTLVIDNLKAAVHQPDWYDPELNPKLRDFALYYSPDWPARWRSAARKPAATISRTPSSWSWCSRTRCSCGRSGSSAGA